ncbi:hypothetical protein [uncultured Desulfovibrio sp.]|uniref:hypothetical protein n=1 Tax=uncultured Desulfovibrio sp. TaxID=167968 RepID=UPI002631F2FA|nr:hypothetical protein [uncultured Desulfovibrio sp.]
MLFSKPLACGPVPACTLHLLRGRCLCAAAAGRREKAPVASEAKAPAHKSGADVEKPAKYASKAAKPETRHPESV